MGSILDKINMGKSIPDGHQDDHYFGVQEKKFYLPTEHKNGRLKPMGTQLPSG